MTNCTDLLCVKKRFFVFPRLGACSKFAVVFFSHQVPRLVALLNTVRQNGAFSAFGIDAAKRL